MAKKKNKFAPLIILSLIICAGLGVYIMQVPKPLDPKESVSDGVGKIRGKHKLSTDDEELLRLQLSLSDYVARHGRPPQKLTQLVPEYFDTLPKDPSTGEVYAYTLSEGTYRLGKQTEEKTATASASTSGDTLSTATDSDSAEFVNPNLMVSEHVVYDPTNRRDPFEPFDLAPKVKIDGSLSPLQQYDVGQLRLTAVIGDSGNPVALVEDAAGRGFTLRVGTKIGNHGGEVAAIESDRVKVLETNIDFTGKEEQRIVEMKIDSDPQNKGKKPAAKRR